MTYNPYFHLGSSNCLVPEFSYVPCFFDRDNGIDCSRNLVDEYDNSRPLRKFRPSYFIVEAMEMTAALLESGQEVILGLIPFIPENDFQTDYGVYGSILASNDTIKPNGRGYFRITVPGVYSIVATITFEAQLQPQAFGARHVNIKKASSTISTTATSSVINTTETVQVISTKIQPGIDNVNNVSTNTNVNIVGVAYLDENDLIFLTVRQDSTFRLRAFLTPNTLSICRIS